MSTKQTAVEWLHGVIQQAETWHLTEPEGQHARDLLELVEAANNVLGCYGSPTENNEFLRDAVAKVVEGKA